MVYLRPHHRMSMRQSPVNAKRASSSSSRLRNLPEVYVLVPPSPYRLVKSRAISTHSTPLRAHNMSNAGSSFLITKRKRSEPTPDETEQHPPEPKTKRRKISAMTSRTQGTRKEVSNATPEFPNGFFYCHQCNKKRDSSGEPALALITRMATVLNPFPSWTVLYL